MTFGQKKNGTKHVTKLHAVIPRVLDRDRVVNPRVKWHRGSNPPVGFVVPGIVSTPAKLAHSQSCCANMILYLALQWRVPQIPPILPIAWGDSRGWGLPTAYTGAAIRAAERLPRETLLWSGVIGPRQPPPPGHCITSLEGEAATQLGGRRGWVSPVSSMTHSVANSVHNSENPETCRPKSANHSICPVYFYCCISNSYGIDIPFPAAATAWCCTTATIQSFFHSHGR